MYYSISITGIHTIWILSQLLRVLLDFYIYKIILDQEWLVDHDHERLGKFDQESLIDMIGRCWRKLIRKVGKP